MADPIIINTNNEIIGGHARVKVLKSQNIEEVEVRVPEQELSEKQCEEFKIDPGITGLVTLEQENSELFYLIPAAIIIILILIIIVGQMLLLESSKLGMIPFFLDGNLYFGVFGSIIEPIVSNAFPRATTRLGFQVRFSLAQ